MVYRTFSLAEATCTSQIRTARAVASEFGASAASSGVGQWANIRESNSERDAQRLIQKHGFTLDFFLDKMVIGQETIPWINPKTWLKFFLRNKIWCQLCGLSPDEAHLAGPTWTRFWGNWKQLYPNFGLFSLPGIDLSRTAAVYIHGDEGRGLKRSAYMVTNIQSALGQGSGPQARKHKNISGDIGDTFRLKLNNLQSSYLTRLITLLVPKSMYDNDDTHDIYLDMVDVLCQALDELLMDGIVDSDGHRYRLCVIGVKGDLPYLSRVSFSERAYNRAVNGGKKGICHLCLAGTPNIPYECAGARKPIWEASLGTTIPWKTESPFTKWLVCDEAFPAMLYRFDIWHIFHLGLGRAYIASTLVLLLSLWDATTTIDARFNELSTSYLRFCKMNKIQAHIRKFTRDFVSYGDPGGVNGYWNKGSLTTALMLWLESYLTGLQLPIDGSFGLALRAAKGANLFFRGLYDCDAFLSAEQCAFISEAGRTFLTSYVELARRCFQDRKPLYPLLPKIHLMDHFIYKMWRDGWEVGLSDNPLQVACQMDEDMVGKASRISRRVSIRLQILRTFQRYLICCHDAFTEASWI